MSDLFTPPRLFSKVRFERHTNRSITWLELFYDLVYVATFIQIGNFLSDNLTLVGFGQFLVLATVVWWSWLGETFYQNRYFVDDLAHRALVFLQVFAIASIGLTVSRAFGDLYVQFTLAYVLTRLTLILMYMRSARAHPEGKRYAHGMVKMFAVGTIIWLGSLFLPADIHWIGWLIGIAYELATPILPQMRHLSRVVGIDRHHLSERFGIFTIIMLGESFVKVLEDSQGTAIGIPQLAFSFGGFVVLFSLWWLYFSDTGDKSADLSPVSTSAKPIAWIYGHLPLSIGLVAFGVGAKKLYGATHDYPEDPANPKYRLLYTAAIVLFLVALSLVDYGIEDSEKAKMRIQEFVHLISAVLVALIGTLATGANPATFVVLVAVIMAAQVGLSIFEEWKLSVASEQ